MEGLSPVLRKIKFNLKQTESPLRLILVILLCLFILPVQAADKPLSAFKKLSCPEKKWVLFHPFVARKAFKASQTAREKSDELAKSDELDRDANGGQVDAFRHSFWMALMSQKMCPAKAIRLGKAHEKGDYIRFKKKQLEDTALPDSVSSVMDLYNNKVGAKTGCENPQLTENELSKLLILKVKAGEMKIIRKDSKGNALDCDRNPIPVERYTGKWGIPKCLIPSGNGSIK